MEKKISKNANRSVWEKGNNMKDILIESYFNSRITANC